MVHHLHRTTLLPHHPTRPLSTLDLFLNPTQSLLLNQSLSPSTTSQCTNRTPSNTLNPILNPSLTIPMLPHHLHPSMSLFMNQLTLSQLITSRRITRSTQSQAPSHTTHLKNHTTHHSKSPTIHLSQNH